MLSLSADFDIFGTANAVWDNPDQDPQNLENRSKKVTFPPHSWPIRDVLADFRDFRGFDPPWGDPGPPSGDPLPGSKSTPSGDPPLGSKSTPPGVWTPPWGTPLRGPP